MNTMQLPILPTDQKLLFRAWQQRGDQAAREELVKRHMPLARSLARRYDRSTEALDDLIQVANLGLVKAIDRFDPDRGTPFSSFAIPTILGELKRYFRDCGWAVHVSRSMQERTMQIEVARRALGAHTGRAPTVAALSQYLEMAQEDVLEGLQAATAYDAISLQTPRPGGDGATTETIADGIGEIDPRFELVDEATSVAGALKHLRTREREVLRLRFGEDLTQSEIAERIGISQMQVSRLLRRSLDRLHELADPPANPGEAGSRS